MTRRRRDDRGSATVLALTMAAVVAVLAVLGGAGGSVLLTHRRAAAAADLAALAGAGALQRGDPACDAAAALAVANGARVLRCVVGEDEVVVRVGRVVTLPWRASHAVTADARAGPVG